MERKKKTSLKKKVAVAAKRLGRLWIEKTCS
jgi:hypothetical protein